MLKKTEEKIKDKGLREILIIDTDMEIARIVY